MKSIRIGNDIRIEWPLTIGEEIATLDNLQVTVDVSPSVPREEPCQPKAPPTLCRQEMTVLGNLGVLKMPCGSEGKECPPPTDWRGGPVVMENKRPMPVPPMQLPCFIDGDKVVALWTSDRQIFLGEYDVTLHIRRNGMGCATADQSCAIRLVAHSDEADVDSDSGVETVITMQTIELSLVGLSAYEVAVLAGFSGSKEEWLASLKGEKGDKGDDGVFSTEQAAALDKVAKEAFRLYTDAPYNMDTCSHDGFYTYCNTGAPSGSEEDEVWLLRVTNGKSIEDGGKYVIEQTCYSYKDPKKVYRRIIWTTDRDQMSSANTTWGDWTKIGGDEFTEEQKKVIQHITEGDYMVGFDLFYDSEKVRARQVYGSKADTYLPIAAATSSRAGVMTATDKANLDKLWKAANPLTLSVSGGGIYEKGTTQEVTVKWTVKSGSDDVTSKSTLTVNDTDVSGTTQASFSDVTSSTTYTVKAVYDGDTVSKSVSATFVNRSYFGVVSSGWTATEANVKALGTSVLKSVKGYDTASFSQSSQKNVYAYPKSFGLLTSITDGKNEFLGSYTLSELTVNGETYYVYVLAESSTVTDYKLKFV